VDVRERLISFLNTRCLQSCCYQKERLISFLNSGKVAELWMSERLISFLNSGSVCRAVDVSGVRIVAGAQLVKEVTVICSDVRGGDVLDSLGD